MAANFQILPQNFAAVCRFNFLLTAAKVPSPAHRRPNPHRGQLGVAGQTKTHCPTPGLWVSLPFFSFPNTPSMLHLRYSAVTGSPSLRHRSGTLSLRGLLPAMGAAGFGGGRFLTTAQGGAPTTLRVLAVNAAAQRQRPSLPLRKSTHPFYISPYLEYPLLLGFGLQPLLSATVQYLHEGYLGLAAEPALLVFGGCVLLWVRDLEELGSRAALYTSVVRANLLCGVLLFILSEVMIFFGLFWSYFHSSLNPAVELGAVWPPAGLAVLEWYRWPTLSTALLVYSGFSANAAYYALKGLLNPRSSYATAAVLPVTSWFGSPTQWGREQLLFGTPVQPSAEGVAGLRQSLTRRGLHLLYGGLVYTIFAGSLFLLCQNHEYGHAAFSMDDGVYPSVFYGLTGLHGLHVMAGLGLLLLTLQRFYAGRFRGDSTPHVAVTATVWYWHFVDVVWIFLYLIVYLWGNAAGAGAEFSNLTHGLAKF